MPHSIRRTQNRVKKETNDIKLSELRALRAENQKLKRDNARLRREHEKTSDAIIEEDIESLAELEAKESGKKVTVNANVCPKCHSENLAIIPAGPKVIIACKDCSWRKAS